MIQHKTKMKLVLNIYASFKSHRTIKPN